MDRKEEGLRGTAFSAGFERAEKCFQCGRCNSACTVSKIVKGYRPSRIVALVRNELPEKALDQLLWDCAKCLKCVEYCPQKVAPADAILDLQYLAVTRGTGFPEAYADMLKFVTETGLAFKQMEVTDKEFETWGRESLGLPPLHRWEDQRKAVDIILKIRKGEM